MPPVSTYSIRYGQEEAGFWLYFASNAAPHLRRVFRNRTAAVRWLRKLTGLDADTSSLVARVIVRLT